MTKVTKFELGKRGGVAHFKDIIGLTQRRSVSLCFYSNSQRYRFASRQRTNGQVTELHHGRIGVGIVICILLMVNAFKIIKGPLNSCMWAHLIGKYWTGQNK